MATVLRGSRVSDHLDAFRGVAAIGVFLGHIRNIFFLDFQDLAARTRLSAAIYFLTGLGHQCVMVFFVLSGFFIAGSVIKDVKKGSWSWRKYSVHRFSRLYVVLIPALLLTMGWDWAGMHLASHPQIYQGLGGQNVVTDVRQKTGIGIFVGNLAFLQTVAVPPLGSNGPLWSLSNEFWYYILFPCLYLLPFGKSTRWVKATGACAAVLIIVGGANLMSLFSVWLMGAAIAIAPLLRFLDSGLRKSAAIFLGGLCFVASLIAARMNIIKSQAASDACVGLGFAILTYFLLHQNGRSAKGIVAMCARRLAGMSYTLYLAHLPLVVFLYALIKKEGRWTPDAEHLAFGGAIASVVFIYAFALANVTEANTARIRYLVGRIPFLRRDEGEFPKDVAYRERSDPIQLESCD